MTDWLEELFSDCVVRGANFEGCVSDRIFSKSAQL